jgi:uncharacterized protein (TIGR00375 family)
MRIIADLHIHSAYSRATSREMEIGTLARWARIKGIDVLGTGDFTHPAHFASICEGLAPAQGGLLVQRGQGAERPVHFMLTAEVSCIYTQGGRTRKIHNLILAPSIDAARRMNSSFARLGNIRSDGRPIFGFSAQDLVKIVMDASPEAMVIPAHAWTPWFSVFGSKSGFDSIEECFGAYTPHIRAIETGLSSSPAMNWRVKSLDGITLISNSDAHSPSKLGREANVFDCAPDYGEIRRIIWEKDRERFLFTIEFYPEEGKYHHDGHRGCGVSFSPAETRKAGGLCPVCGNEVTIGVMSRVEELADRPEGFVPEGAVGARCLVPLDEILSAALSTGAGSARVKREYMRIATAGGGEFAVLLDMPEDELLKVAGPAAARAILKARSGDIKITPGFDGQFGRVSIPAGQGDARPAGAGQIGLF